jgi:hypothetical protein
MSCAIVTGGFGTCNKENSGVVRNMLGGEMWAEGRVVGSEGGLMSCAIVTGGFGTCNRENRGVARNMLGERCGLKDVW